MATARGESVNNQLHTNVVAYKRLQTVLYLIIKSLTIKWGKEKKENKKQINRIEQMTANSLTWKQRL